MSQNRIPNNLDQVLFTDREGKTFSSRVTSPPHPSDPELRLYVMAVAGPTVDYSRGFRFSLSGGANTWRWPA